CLSRLLAAEITIGLERRCLSGLLIVKRYPEKILRGRGFPLCQHSGAPRALSGFDPTFIARLDPPLCSDHDWLFFRSSDCRLFSRSSERRLFFWMIDCRLFFRSSDRRPFFQNRDRWVFFRSSDRRLFFRMSNRHFD